VVISLVLTSFAMLMLVLHMPAVSALVAVMPQADDASLVGGRGGDIFHAGWGLVVLLVVTVPTIYKRRA
jgi:hypothetical protein